MSTSVEDIMRARYDELAALRQKLLDDLAPVEEEWNRLGAALQAMGLVVDRQVGAVMPAQADVSNVRLLPSLVPMGAEPEDDTGTARALHRVRHPDVQRAIETQTPSQAIPKGTALYCSEGCTTAHPSGGFTDLMALRTHSKRNHDREPTEQEKVPR